MFFFGKAVAYMYTIFIYFDFTNIYYYTLYEIFYL